MHLGWLKKAIFEDSIKGVVYAVFVPKMLKISLLHIRTMSMVCQKKKTNLLVSGGEGYVNETNHHYVPGHTDLCSCEARSRLGHRESV
jgi:hypothetical protein